MYVKVFNVIGIEESINSYLESMNGCIKIVNATSIAENLVLVIFEQIGIFHEVN